MQLIDGSVSVTSLQNANQDESISLVSYSSFDCADSGTIKSTSYNHSNALIDDSPDTRVPFYGIIRTIGDKHIKGPDCIHIYDSEVKFTENLRRAISFVDIRAKISVSEDSIVNISILGNDASEEIIPFLISYDYKNCQGRTDINRLKYLSPTKYTSALDDLTRNYKLLLSGQGFRYLGQCINIGTAPTSSAPIPSNLRYTYDGKEYVKIEFDYYGKRDDEIMIRAYLDEACKNSILYSHNVSNIENNEVAIYLPIDSELTTYFKLFSTRNSQRKYTSDSNCVAVGETKKY